MSEDHDDAERLVVRIYRTFGRETPSWLLCPNLWLGDGRHIDLLETEAGRQLLGNYLTRLELGVYT